MAPSPGNRHPAPSRLPPPRPGGGVILFAALAILTLAVLAILGAYGIPGTSSDTASRPPVETTGIAR